MALTPDMLWYKAWFDTRWRFVIGLILVVCSAMVVVFTYPRVAELMPLVPGADTGGDLGRRIREAATLARSYRGFVWSQWFGQELAQIGTLFAVILGSGSAVSQPLGSGTLFTLSLPASRMRLLGVRGALGLVELFALAAIPTLVILLLSPAIDETYAVGDAVVHALCLFVACSVFFSLALLLSTVFVDLWRPLLIALAIAVALALAGQMFPEVAPFNIYTLMTGERYFRAGRIPWIGLLASGAASGALLYASSINIANRDF